MLTRRRLLQLIAVSPALAVVGAAAVELPIPLDLSDIWVSKYGTPIDYNPWCCRACPDDPEPHFHRIESVRWIETNQC